MTRIDILNQVASGSLSAEEATRLLSAPGAAKPASTGLDPALAGRWLRIRTTDLTTGRQTVNINVPLTWVDAGLKLGSHYHAQVAGVDLGDLFQQIQAGAQGRLVEVEDLDDDERVEIFVE